jgi:hypothetical protein
MISDSDTRAAKLAMARVEFAGEIAKSVAWLNRRERIPAGWVEAFAGMGAWLDDWMFLQPPLCEEYIRVGAAFVDQWSLEASEIGWQPYYVFGLDALLTSMPNRAVIAITRNSATLHSPPPFKTRTLLLHDVGGSCWCSMGHYHDRVRHD